VLGTLTTNPISISTSLGWVSTSPEHYGSLDRCNPFQFNVGWPYAYVELVPKARDFDDTISQA
jgi:hypothetical protein